MRQGAHHEPRKAGCLRHARKPDSSRGRARRTAHHGAGNAGGGAGRAVPAVGAGSAGCRICSLRRRKRRHGPHRLLWRRGSARTGGHCAGGRGPGRAAHGRRNNKPGGCVPRVDRGRAGGGEEETSGRADEDEDGTAAQAALEMAGDAPEEIASEEESTAHAHQPENGEEERK